jgi:hypothetical protein
MSLIGLLAKKQHGKDTCADHLINNYGFVKGSFARPLKEGCASLFGFTDEQLYGNKKEEIDPFWGVSPRKIFQYIGTDIFRNDINKIIPNLNDDFWVRCFVKKYKTMIEKYPNNKVVISDVRFQNEVDAIHELGGIVIKLERPNLYYDKDEHISEAGIDLIQNYDNKLLNDGSIEDLYNKIELLAHQYRN